MSIAMSVAYRCWQWMDWVLQHNNKHGVNMRPSSDGTFAWTVGYQPQAKGGDGGEPVTRGMMLW